MDTGAPPKVSLNGPLVAEAQATLARMPVAQRAYTLLKSQSRNALIEDWVASRRGGPDMGLVFEAANGASLDTVRVPGFFTYNGFYKGLIDHMPTIAGALAKDTWVLGPSGQQSAVQTQYDRLFPDILDLYSNDFIAAWNAAITNLSLRPLLADRPKYLALSAASAPTSPIKQVFESIRNETALTRERPAPPAAPQNTAGSDAAALAAREGPAEALHHGARGRRYRPEVAAPRRRAGGRHARRLDRGLFQADPAAGRRRRRLAADRRSARQSQRALSPTDARGEQSRAVEAGAGAGRGRGGEPALQRDAPAAAARRHDGQGRPRCGGRRQQPHDRPAHRSDGAGGDGALPAGRQQPLSLLAQRPRRRRSPISRASSRPTASSTNSSPPISPRSPIPAPRPGPGAATPTSRGRCR